MKKVVLLVTALVLLKWWFSDPSIDVSTNGLSFSYTIKYPANNDKSDRLPMLVALHGNGDKPENFYNTALDQFSSPARIILLKGPLSYGRGSAWPWSATDFDHYGKAINEAIELLADKYPTRQKPVLLGFSGGGMMAYYQAVKYGDSYSYIFPVSGKLSNDLLGEKPFKQGAEVLAFHGKQDQVISINSGKQAVNILKTNGVNIKFTEFDGNHHGIFTDMKSVITQAAEEKLRSLR